MDDDGDDMEPGEDASKKQTPFSVWYRLVEGRLEIGVPASKKQTPFSVWYARRQRDVRLDCPRSLKEADAFQRLVLSAHSPRPSR